MVDILGDGARGIEDYTWPPVASLVLAYLQVCSLCHTLPGHEVSLERCEQGSILQQQTKAIIPAGTEGSQAWTSLLRCRSLGPGSEAG